MKFDILDLIAVGIVISVAYYWGVYSIKPSYKTYAVHQDGTVAKVDKLYAIPMADVNDANGVWPKYVMIQ